MAVARAAGDALHHVHRGRGQQRQREHDRDRDRDRDRQSQVAEQLPLDVLKEQHRHEDGDRGRGGCEQGPCDLARAFPRCLRQCEPGLAQANDISGHDDCAFNDHADRECQSRQGNHVQAAAQQGQRDEGSEQAKRNRRRDQPGDPKFAHEPPDDAQCQQRSDHQVLRQQAHGPANEERRIERLFDAKSARLQRPFAQLGDRCLHRIQRRQHVGAVGAPDLNAERRIAVLIREELPSRRTDIDACDVRQMHGPAVPPGEHQTAELLRIETTGESQRVLTAADVELAARDVVGARGAARDVRQPHSLRRGPRRIDGDVHVVGRPGVDRDGGDPRYRLEPGAHRVLDESAMAFDRTGRTGKKLHEKPGQGVVGVVVTAERDDGPVRIARQRLQAVHPAQHFDQRVAHVGADRKAQRDRGLAGICVAFELLDAGQPLQYFLERFENLGLDFFRRCGRPGRLDRDLRPVDVREQLQRQMAEAQQPQQTDEHHQHDHRDRIAGRPVQGFHDVVLGLAPRGDRAS